MKPIFLLLSIVLSMSVLTPVTATSVLPISLQQLSSKASLIFYAEVTNNQVKKDEQSGYIATFTEFKILQSVKGNVGSSHTIKQIGGYDEASARRLNVPGVPDFQQGKQYVVFLPEKSSLGFSSPLGLHQGQFHVLTHNNQQIVSNGRRLEAAQQASQVSPNIQVAPDNENIQLPLAVSAENPSQSHLQDFINTVRAYNEQ